MPWNFSVEERLVGFLNKILPSGGGSSPAHKKDVHESKVQTSVKIGASLSETRKQNYVHFKW